MTTIAQAPSLDLAKLEPVFAKYAGQTGVLIAVLQEAQEIYGYLPPQVLTAIAGRLGVPVSQVYGVVTFYAQFHMKPRGKHIVRTCQGTACHVRGASKILAALEETLGVKPGDATADLQFTLETVACIGACGLAPVMMVDHDTHGRLTPDLVPGILDKYRD